MKIALIGAGNVATQLGSALLEAGCRIVQVYSRTAASAAALAGRLGAAYVDQAGEVTGEADLYILSVKDDAIVPVIDALPFGKGLYVHTAGSVAMEVFAGKTERYGVLYPLQTFSKAREVSFREIPLLLEAAREEDAKQLEDLAGKLSGRVRFVSSEKRQYLHLAAVFACNFANHMYALAAEIVENEGLDGSLLQALIRETAAKIESLSPLEAQTGPAVRDDGKVMARHVDLIEDEKTKELYRLVSQSIRAKSRERRKD